MSDHTVTWANVFDARPETELPAESPLAWSYHHSGRPAVSEKSRVVLRERAMAGQLILRGGAIVLDEAVRGVLGVGLPGRPNTLTLDESGERSIQWLSPDEAARSSPWRSGCAKPWAMPTTPSSTPAVARP